MTQHYVGTKIIEAWPAQKDGADGYSVKYADGYISWSPKDAFDDAYLPLGHIGSLPAHVQRLVAELEQLGDRINKLVKFQGTDIYAGLPEEERKDLDAQAKCMTAYWDVLLCRVNRAREQSAIAEGNDSGEG